MGAAATGASGEALEALGEEEVASVGGEEAEHDERKPKPCWDRGSRRSQQP